MIPSVVSHQIRETLTDYLRTTFALNDAALEHALFDFLSGPQGLFKGPYLDVRLPFRRADPHATIPLEIRPPFVPFAHQLDAFTRLSSQSGHQPQHTLVTTGTGSGKTECFLYPILDHCFRHRGTPGIKAVILYPMNALASDQARRLARMLWEDERLKGHVSAGLYIGGKGRHGAADREHLVDKRDILKQSPPDILLTNYKMLDFLLLRPDDRPLWAQNTSDTLRYLVLDELHTYDGAQGSDVACLIRRLKARLAIAPGSLCCVGTSATIGSRHETSSARLLTEFASRLFGEPFARDSVITEDRLETREALGPDADLDRMPKPSDAEALDPERFTDRASWIARQCALWLGASALNPIDVGARLKRHVFLRSVLRALGGAAKAWSAFDASLARLDPSYAELPESLRWPVVQSFVALVSHAREPVKNGETVPFLTVQVQLWVRELRRLVRRVATKPEFAWNDDLESADDSHWLPVVHCRECGSSGFGSRVRDGESRLLEGPREIGEAYLRRSKHAKYVLLGAAPGRLVTDYVCPKCLQVNGSAECGCGFKEGLAAQIDGTLTDSEPRRFRQHCPECGSDHALSILGSRAPSLSSVAITHLFLSPYNDDRKLLAFTDSVQDASHYAAFFGARTYRFNLRTAIQSVIEKRSGDVRLDAIVDELFARWEKELGRPAFVETFLPPDLRDIEEHENWRESEWKDAKSARDVIASLRKRLSWEVVSEYGHNALIGRTLERTACSTAFPDMDAVSAAATRLVLDLREQHVLATTDIDSGSVRHFLDGLLHRLRVRGGVFDPLLKAYVSSDGVGFLLNRRKNRLIAPFGRFSRLPRFITLRDAHETFDALLSRSTSESWHRDWAARALGIDRRDDGINDLYLTAIKRLVEGGVLGEVEVKKWRVQGLDPTCLRVTREVGQVACPACHTRVTLPAASIVHWEGRACTRFRCEGRFERTASSESYYTKVYRSGHVKRIFTGEHTGLLSRESREDLEERFKQGTDPDAPNLLACTPTLEMGIDIGDLSAVLACSVPPATANFLQRIGRAGRKTGNSLALTLAEAQPHDLYFFDDPMEMIAGEVLPPGSFLDAPEMLRRQLVAFGMDAWAKQERELKSIPREVKFLAADLSAPGFPGSFLTYYAQHEQAIVGSFLAMFGSHLSTENQARLRASGAAKRVADEVIDAFETVRVQVNELRALSKRLLTRIQQLDADPAALVSDEVKFEKQDAEEARKVVARLMADLLKKYPLNVLTDAGVLPNYAFPEPGVTLKSVVRRDIQSKPSSEDAKDAKKKRYDTFEYHRAASTALREFAPFNTFYADGRRVRVSEVDVGNKARPLLERWRFCGDCHHAESVLDDSAPSATCPRCKGSHWSDAGQVRTLVRFRNAASIANRLEAVTVDDSDDRDEREYIVRSLIDVGEEQWGGARVVEDLPFGFELLKNVTLREVNFGPTPGFEAKFPVAGTDVPGDGFVVCPECGRVKEPDAKGEKTIDHSPWCTFRKNPKNERLVPVFLYRQIESEAIRVLLPVSTVGIESSRASFDAALDLGFRRKFRGNPGHLLITYVSEPVSNDSSASRRFLVIYDGVPGGTGYLAELWKANGFMEVLELAYEAMRSCTCQSDPLHPDRDGCYRCLLAYQPSRDLPNISRRRAMELLREILDRKDQLTEVTTLSTVDMEALLESELETRFVAALEGYAKSQKWEWSKVAHRGKPSWRVTIDGVPWVIEPQVDLGPDDRVSVKSRPDFLIQRLDGKEGLPVAVFCDGLGFHVLPEQAHGRIHDDVTKRQAIIDSGRFVVWSVTWKDIEAFVGGSESEEKTAWFADASLAAVQKLFVASGVSLPRDVGLFGTMAGLVQYLRSPAIDTWRTSAGLLLMALLLKKNDWPVAAIDSFEHRLLDAPARFEDDVIAKASNPQSVFAWTNHRPWFQSLVRAPLDALKRNDPTATRATLRLFDEHVARKDAAFEEDWRLFLRAWNIVQFHPGVAVVTSEQLGPQHGGRAKPPSVRPPPPAAPKNAALESLLDLTSTACTETLLACAERALPLPEPGLELVTSGRVVGQLELAWESHRIAAVLDGQERDRTAAEQDGWRVWALPADRDALLAALAAAVAQ